MPLFADTSDSATTVKLTVPDSSVPISDIQVRYTSAAADPPTSGPKASSYWGGDKVEAASIAHRPSAVARARAARAQVQAFSKHGLWRCKCMESRQ